MKKITLIFSAILLFAAYSFSQVQQGDIKIIQ